MAKIWFKWPVVVLSLLCLGGYFSFGNKKAQTTAENKKAIEPKKTEAWEVAFTIEYTDDKNDEPVGDTAILAAKNWKLGVVPIKAEEE